jgi:streptogramin lyase
MPPHFGGLSSADGMKRQVFLLPVLCVALASAAAAQTSTPSPTPTRTPTPPPVTPTPVVPTTVAAGTTYTTENSARVSGVRLVVDDGGGIWFVEAGTDRIGVLRGTTITYWQIRSSDNIGANPVDIRLDGDNVWILETGQSLAPAGTCTLAKLNTTTNQLDEWVVPGSIPGSWYQAPDGKYWFPMSGGTLQSADFTTGAVVNHRSSVTRAYSDATVGPDGALWLVDFGNNRIVRYVPDADEETYWVFFDPTILLNPTQIQFDDKGQLWICQLAAGRMDRFDPATNVLYSYLGMSNPIHFDFYQDKIYVTSGQTNPAINVLDPKLAAPVAQLLTPVTVPVSAVPSSFKVTFDTRTAIKSTFTSTSETMPADGFSISSNVSYPGILVTQFPPTHAFGMAIVGGEVWTGQDGKIANVRLQTVGGPADTTVPVATSSAGNADDRIRIDITLSNKGTSAIGGEALYMYSPGAFAARATFTVGPGATQVLTDAFGNIGTAANIATGSVRVRALTGTAGDLVSSVRSTRIVPGGKTWGYALGGQNTAQCLGPGSETTLFTGGRAGEAEVSILGLYTPSFATGTMTLVSPDGAVRGTRPISIAINTRDEYNPAASAFGVAPEPGDVIRVSVETGALQAYVNVLDLGTIDVATRIPVAAGTEFVIPIAGEIAGASGQSFVSDLQLSNPSGDTTANVTVTFSPIAGSAPEQVAPVGLPPGNSVYIADFLPTLFGIASGQGAVIVSSNVPIAVGARLASRFSYGDYGGFAAGIPGSSGIQNGSAIGIGLPQTSERRTNLLLYNSGAEGSFTVTGFKADGGQVGPISVALGAQESGRLNSVFAALGVTNQEGGRIRVDVPANMKIYAWTAEVDGQSGDVDLFPLQ